MSDVKRRILEKLEEGADDACDAVVSSSRGKLMLQRYSTRTVDAWKIINVLLERTDVADEKAAPMDPVDLMKARERLMAARRQA